MTKTRNESLDIARGIAMLGVIVLHMELVGLYPIVAAFNVTLFYLITGYLTRPADNMREYIKKRAGQLLLPYAVTSAVIILIAVVRGFFRDGAIGSLVALGQWTYAALYGAGDEYITPFYIPSIGAIWFLWASLWGVLILQLVLRLQKKAWQILLLTALFAAAAFSAEYIWLPFSVQAGMCAAGFMYIGCRTKEWIPIFRQAQIWQKGLFLTGCAIAYGLFCRYFIGFWPVHCEFAHGPLDIAGSLAACVLVMVVSKGIAEHGRLSKKFLSLVGKYSLVVLCMHIIELDIFPWKEISFLLVSAGMSEYLAWNIVVRLLKLVWIAAATIVCVRLPLTRRIFSVK